MKNIINKSKFGILLTTKNTYSMIDEWLSFYDYSNIPILNLDLDSNKTSEVFGRKICRDNKIYFQKADSLLLQDNLHQAFDFFKKKDIDWILYMHHDAYPLQENCLENINNLLRKSKKIKDFGMIGFNIYHDDYDLKNFNKNEIKLMTTARAPLELGNGYYNRKFSSRVNYNNFKIKPFAVECPFQSTILLNYYQYKNNIKVDYNFNFFHSWDDVAFQFMKKNIYNIVIPTISFAHDQSLKIKHGLPFSSPNGNTKLYGRFDHLEKWNRKWNFNFSLSKFILGGDSFINKNGLINKCIDLLSNFFQTKFFTSFETISRISYKNNLKKSREKNSKIINHFYYHDPRRGPLRYFNLK
jgi:hypothetical protein